MASSVTVKFNNFPQIAEKLPDIARALNKAAALAVAELVAPTALAHHISHVSQVRCSKQMRGITARRIVAAVADELAGRYRAAAQFIGYPRRDFPTTIQDKDAVSGAYVSSLPRPALIRLATVHLAPKAFSKGAIAVSGLGSTRLRTVDASADIHLANGGRKVSTAYRAIARDVLTTHRHLLLVLYPSIHASSTYSTEGL